MKLMFSLVAAMVMAPSAAWACCAASSSEHPVRIADQEILVTWDPASGLEHFVRRATFRTGQAKDFGFLVPTPNEPKLAEADDAGFDRLAALIKPEHVTSYVPEPVLLLLAPFWLTAKSAAVSGVAVEAPVRVLNEQRVAGYDAVVLEADNAKALTDWLGAHGYDARPEVTDWVKPYVAARWKVTGFKYAAGEPREMAGVRTGTVRMTFKTERPLFPYRVPSDNRSSDGHLRVFFVGPERVTGKLGPAEWHGHTMFSNATPGTLDALAGVVPTGELPKGTWLSVFDDHRWPGSGDDLYFLPSADKAPVLPPPIVHRHGVPIPLDVIAATGGIGFVVWRRRRKKSQPRAESAE